VKTGNSDSITVGFVRYFRILGFSVNAYKLFLCVGLYVGTLATAALAASSALSPLKVGICASVCALAGIIGARAYYVLMYASQFIRLRSFARLWDPSKGGLSCFGALLTFVPTTFAAAAWLRVPAPVLLDHIGIGVLAGGMWVRLGCIFNGCCCGRLTKGRWGVELHDICGVKKQRIPLQVLEITWLLIGLCVFCILWPKAFAAGSYALGVLVWYGSARFFLERFREHSTVVVGIYIDQIVAALIAISAGIALAFRGFANLSI
jgi:phosphatidylglycerol:prolipoprotein diacylglycerol transferase